MMRLTFELGYNNAGEHYPIYGRPEQNKRQRGRRDSPPFSVSLFEMEYLISCPQTAIYTTSHPSFQAFGLRLNYTNHQLSWVSCLQTAHCGTAQPPLLCEPISHSKSLDICIHMYMYPVSLKNLTYLEIKK